MRQNILYNPIDIVCQVVYKINMQNKKTITINGLDLLKAMENAKTPLNPFYRKRQNVKNKNEHRVKKQTL